MQVHKFVFINPTFCVGSGVRLFQGRFCAYAWTLLHKDEFSFENENQPVCVSVSSCLTLNVSSIFMSSFSSLINTIFIIELFLQEFFCVWTLLFKKRIINRKKSIKSKLNL